MKVEISIMEEIARKAAPLFLDRRQAGEIRTKGLADFVTQVDIRVQELVKTELARIYPEIQFMGEEKDNGDVDFARDVWILDPVDGTTNLIHDLRCSVLSLALWQEGEVRLGLIFNPYTDEVFTAEKGKGAFLNGEPIHVSHTETMEDSLISIGTSPYRKELAEENFKLFQLVFSKCADIRRSGSAAMDLANVAAGRLDAYFERGLKPWDFAAGLLLVQEAGGQVTGYGGETIDPTVPASIVAGNGRIGWRQLFE